MLCRSGHWRKIKEQLTRKTPLTGREFASGRVRHVACFIFMQRHGNLGRYSGLLPREQEVDF